MLGTTTPFPLSTKNLDQRVGNARIKDFLYPRADRDWSFEKYDFNVKALDTTNLWTVAAGAGATTWAVRAEAGGWLRGVTGASAGTSGLQLSIPQKYFTGTSLGGFAALIRLSKITEVRLTCGFADALPSVNTKIVNSLSTPTFNTATAGAMYVYDHATSVTTSGLYTIGTSVAAAKLLTTTNRFVATTTLFVAVELSTAIVTCWLGDGDAPLAKATAAITPSDGLIPFIEAQGSDANSCNVDIDTIWHWSARV